MRKPSTTKKQASMGAGKETILKRPQRGLGVAELERIRLQEEQEERLLYHATSHQHHHHLNQLQQPAASDHSTHYNLHYQQPPFFSSHHLPCNPNFTSSNPNPMISSPNFTSPNPNPIVSNPSSFIHPNPKTNGEAPTCNTSFILAPAPTCKASLSSNAAVQPLACLPTKPILMSTHPTYTAEHSEFWVSMAAPKSPFANAAAASFSVPNPNVAPFHNTNPNLKIPSPKSASNTTFNPSQNTDLIELSFLPLHSSSFDAADDSAPTRPSLNYHAAAADGGLCCTLEAPLYHNQFMCSAASSSAENSSSLTDSCLDPSPSSYGHNCNIPKSNIPTLPLQDAEKLELPSFQNIPFKTEEIMNCAYEKKYMSCNFDLNNMQGEYEPGCDSKFDPRTKTTSFGGTSTIGVNTPPRNDFLKLGLPTIAEEWSQGNMQMLAHFSEHTINPTMDLCHCQMVKWNKPTLDLELKLSLPSFGY